MHKITHIPESPIASESGVVLMLGGSMMQTQFLMSLMMQTRSLMSLMMQTRSLFESHFRVRPFEKISIRYIILSFIFSPCPLPPESLCSQNSFLIERDPSCQSICSSSTFFHILAFFIHSALKCQKSTLNLFLSSIVHYVPCCSMTENTWNGLLG